jgi:shikimate kinase
MRIYLVGFMGSGKSTVGEKLASRLGFAFIDLDSVISAKAGRSIKEIFSLSGEAYFRQLEHDTLRETRLPDSVVVATGGGTFAFEENIQFIRSSGLSIYLAAPFDLLAQRIAGKADERPLFRDDRAAYELYQLRAKYYRMADRTVEIRTDETAAEVVERIVIDLARDCFIAPSRPAPDKP